MTSSLLIAFFGLIISTLVYLKDRPVIVVSLFLDIQFDGENCIRGDKIKPDGEHFAIQVYNAGRRPVYVSAPVLLIPNKIFSLDDGNNRSGFILSEGEKPVRKVWKLTLFSQHKELSKWWGIRAAVQDVTGKNYYSEYLTKAPSWAKDIPAPASILMRNKIMNLIRANILQHLP